MTTVSIQWINTTQKNEKKNICFPPTCSTDPPSLMLLSCATPDPMSQTLTSAITERHRLFPLLCIEHHHLNQTQSLWFPLSQINFRSLGPPGFWWRDSHFPFFCMTNTQFIYSVFINTWFMQIARNNLHEKEQFERRQSQALMKKPQRKICSRRL